MNRELTMLWVHAERIGYGRGGGGVARDVRARGGTVDDDDVRPEEYKGADRTYEGHQAVPPTPTNTLSLMSVPTHLDGRYDGQFLSILTMWESGVLPPAFRDTLHEYDLVMVPSPHNV